MDKIIAVDFDGTLCESNWPGIGEPHWDIINHVKEEQNNGSKIILWTNRKGKSLYEALAWCIERGIWFHAVNENLPEVIDEFGGDSRKIFAHEYIDDRSIHPDYIRSLKTKGRHEKREENKNE